MGYASCINLADNFDPLLGLIGGWVDRPSYNCEPSAYDHLIINYPGVNGSRNIFPLRIKSIDCLENELVNYTELFRVYDIFINKFMDSSTQIICYLDKICTDNRIRNDFALAILHNWYPSPSLMSWKYMFKFDAEQAIQKIEELKYSIREIFTREPQNSEVIFVEILKIMIRQVEARDEISGGEPFLDFI